MKPAPQPGRSPTTTSSRPQLLVRAGDEVCQDEKDMLARAHLADLAPLEAWTSQGTNRQIAYATHGIYRYFGKFPPPLAAHLIARYSAEADWVLDPMAGSGTTAVEALLARRHVIARDVSPLSVLLSRVKTTHVAAPAARAGLASVRSTSQGRLPVRCRYPVGLRNPRHWFLPATVRSLQRIRTAIDQEPDGDCTNLILAAFAATVRRVSRATTQQGRLFLDADTALPDAWPPFQDRFEAALDAVDRLPADPETRVIVHLHSVLERPPPAPGVSPRLIIAHPPYFNNYKYSAINSLELAWLGVDPRQVRQQEIRESFKTGRPEQVGRYVRDMIVAIENLTSELAAGGTLALMIGDTAIRGSYIPTTHMILSGLAHLPLRLTLVALRVPQYTEASWVASQRRKKERVGIDLRDFVLVFQKSARPCEQTT